MENNFLGEQVAVERALRRSGEAAILQGVLTSLALRAGEARDEQGRAAATQGPLHRGVPGGGGEGGSRRLPGLPRPTPAATRPVSPPQDQPFRDGPLRVAVKPRQRLVLRVLREHTVGGLGTAGRGHCQPEGTGSAPLCTS